MELGEIEELAAKMKSPKARGGGPKTDAGKWRSAVNAVRHGLGAKHLLLPGESAENYEKKMDEIFSSFAPSNTAEAEVVALIADDLHRLDRLARVEKALLLGRIEEMVSQTGSGEKVGVMANAISVLGTAVASWANAGMPKPGEDVRRQVSALRHAVGVVETTVPDIPREMVAALDDLLDQLLAGGVLDEIHRQAFDAARVLLTFLLDRGAAEDAEQDRLRAAISDLALPEEAELRKLGRYRKLLEDSLQRRLAALDQLRKITAGQVAVEADVEKAKEYRVRLRVVT